MMTNASGRDTAYSGVVDDVSHHHYVQKFALQDEKIPTRKLVYIVCLLLALRIIQRGTDATIFDTIQLHEPSNRIFRSLFEVVLLLVCCSASIYVWIRYIPLAITENLLFQPAESSLFASLTTSYDDEVSNNLNGAHGDDLFQSEGAGDSKSITQQQDAKKYDQNLELESKDMLSVAVANFEVEGTTITSSRDKAAKNSSPIAILGSALDLLVWSLVALVLYMVTAIEAVDARPSEESNNLVSMLARIAAPTFPLLLFLFTAVRTVHPWRSRVNIIEIVSYTISAPFYEVTFRDGMIGDVLTSMVRPMQDIAFTFCYILFGLRGWWSKSYYFPDASQTAREFITPDQSGMFTPSSSSFLEAADASVPVMERSWILHTAILPACMISPLWWRFLQNMRQTYDNKKRWPYLGNALKYFAAAQVAMVGVYHPQIQKSSIWLTSFVVATLYQIWWDVFMDWGLFVRDARSGAWKLRSQRLYPSHRIYWALAIINTLLRFCWTLSFMPLRYVSAAGVLTSNFPSDTWTSILVPTIASAEIVRRTLWGFLRVEWEAIKVRSEGNGMHHDDNDQGNLEMTPMSMPGGSSDESSIWRFTMPKVTSDMSSMNNIQVLGELCMYATTFAILGLIVAFYRETL